MGLPFEYLLFGRLYVGFINKKKNFEEECFIFSNKLITQRKQKTADSAGTAI